MSARWAAHGAIRGLLGVAALACTPEPRVAPPAPMSVSVAPVPSTAVDAGAPAPALLPRPPDPKEPSRFDVDAGLLRVRGAFAIVHMMSGEQQSFDLPTAFTTCSSSSQAVYVRFERTVVDGGTAMAKRPSVREGLDAAVECLVKRLDKYAPPWRLSEELVQEIEVFVVAPRP